MKTMKIEKHLLFTDVIDELKTLKVNDALTYQHEMEGIRAIGPIYLTGSCLTKDGQEEVFQETLEMDVLAPNAKLTQDPFYLQIENYEGTINEEGVCIHITMSIHGVGDDANPISVEPSTPSSDMPPYVAPPLEETKTMPPCEEEQEPTNGMDEFEDLFEDDETTYTSYRMIVARGNDTYDTIAERYAVKSDSLREANHDKEVHEKSLVILPPDTSMS